MKQMLLKLSGIALLAVAFGALAVADERCHDPVVPEIDPASGANAIALVAGALLVLRSCR